MLKYDIHWNICKLYHFAFFPVLSTFTTVTFSYVASGYIFVRFNNFVTVFGACFLLFTIQCANTSYENNFRWQVYSKQLNVEVKFTLEQARKAQRGAEVLFYSFFNLSTRCGWMVNASPWPLYPQERHGCQCTGGWVKSKQLP
jgi:hypothetical protein